MLFEILILQIFCGRLAFICWLQNHLLPCPFKYFTGIDCPGCGFQRSVLALVQGSLHQSFVLYPPAIPLIIFFAYGLADKYFKLDNPNDRVKKILFMITGTIVLLSYGVKLWELHEHYTASV
ncbi:MAG TPA: DUF2752 domain-containing protein [Mucilaginibacter sp.]|jgi:hypothetical protein